MRAFPRGNTNLSRDQRTPVASVGRTKFFRLSTNPTNFVMEDSRLGCPFFCFFFLGNSKASEMLHFRNPMRSEQRERSLGKPDKIKTRRGNEAFTLRHDRGAMEHWRCFCGNEMAVLRKFVRLGGNKRGMCVFRFFFFRISWKSACRGSFFFCENRQQKLSHSWRKRFSSDSFSV